MTYKIIGDSCLDLTDELKKDSRFQMIPLTLQVGTATVVDDETFNQKKFIDMVKACPECPKTACPSPETFKEAYEAADAEGVFVITLSGHLSGSYNSAALAKKLYEEEQAEKGEQAQKKQVAVIDSLSASSGELNIGLFIQSLCEAGLEFSQVLEKALGFRDRMHTYFVLESLDTLRKNGRLSGLQAFFATALNIKPVMGADSGVIIKLDHSLLEAARDLGAGSLTVFRRVILPLSLPGVVSGITMVFVPSVSTFAISRMLGGGTELLLGDLIERQFLGGAYNPQLGAAISLVMMIIVLVCMLVMNRFGEGEEQAVKL